MKMPGDARWTVLGLLFVGGMINYLDRSAIGVAAPFLAKQLSLSPSELGWVFSVFFFGYAAFCFVGGYASDRIGGRNVFAIAAVVWSVFCGLTAFVFSYTSLLIVRVILFGRYLRPIRGAE
jgi:MFS transporter, ACS family, hexuronate transporter